MLYLVCYTEKFNFSHAIFLHICFLFFFFCVAISGVGGDILLYPDNVWDSATTGYMALRHRGDNGDQPSGVEGLGNHHHIFELRLWTRHWINT